jgi:hypothetical protein
MRHFPQQNATFRSSNKRRVRRLSMRFSFAAGKQREIAKTSRPRQEQNASSASADPVRLLHKKQTADARLPQLAAAEVKKTEQVSCILCTRGR